MASLCLAGGRVVDPANGVNDEVRDIWIDGGRVIAPPADPEAKADRTIDARGYVVMPGGVDVHSHIAGSKVNGARALRPEERRGADGSLAAAGRVPVGNAGERAQHLRHRVPVRRARLHDGGGRGDPTARRPGRRTRSSATRPSWTS